MYIQREPYYISVITVIQFTAWKVAPSRLISERYHLVGESGNSRGKFGQAEWNPKNTRNAGSTPARSQQRI